jgi:hypothetical protein
MKLAYPARSLPVCASLPWAGYSRNHISLAENREQPFLMKAAMVSRVKSKLDSAGALVDDDVLTNVNRGFNLTSLTLPLLCTIPYCWIPFHKFVAGEGSLRNEQMARRVPVFCPVLGYRPLLVHRCELHFHFRS